MVPTPTLDAAILSSSRAVADLGRTSVICLFFAGSGHKSVTKNVLVVVMSIFLVFLILRYHFGFGFLQLNPQIINILMSILGYFDQKQVLCTSINIFKSIFCLVYCHLASFQQPSRVVIVSGSSLLNRQVGENIILRISDCNKSTTKT